MSEYSGLILLAVGLAVVVLLVLTASPAERAQPRELRGPASVLDTGE